MLTHTHDTTWLELHHHTFSARSHSKLKESVSSVVGVRCHGCAGCYKAILALAQSLAVQHTDILSQCLTLEQWTHHSDSQHHSDISYQDHVLSVNNIQIPTQTILTSTDQGEKIFFFNLNWLGGVFKRFMLFAPNPCPCLMSSKCSKSVNGFLLRRFEIKMGNRQLRKASSKFNS